MTKEGDTVQKRLVEELGLSAIEAETYMTAIRKGSLAEGPAIESLMRRGMLIRSTDEKGYLPVHPRLALSNLFRSYGDRTTPAMREKRKAVDRLTAELIVVYEVSRGLR